MESVLEGTTISQQGTRFALGRGNAGYVVLDTTAPGAVVVATFSLSAEGWFSARREFERLEEPTSGPDFATPVAAQMAGSMTVSSALLLAGVTIGAAGLFPSYLSGSSLASQGDQLLPHLVYLVGWALAGVLILSARHARVAAVAAAGLSAMSFGFFVTDVGSAASTTGQSPGAGFYLSLIGWAVCAGGSLSALLGTRDTTSGDKFDARARLLIGGVVVVIGAVVTFALPWDHYHLVATATGQSQSFNVGNAFSNPGAVIVGELITMAAALLLLGLALAWRPIVTGAALFVGALVPLVAQLFSALLQPAPPLSDFGVSQAIAAQDQIHLSAGYTPWFYLYCLAIGLLVVTGGWLVSRAAPAKD